MATHAQPSGPPPLSLSAIFFKFLRYGFLAFGGPVAQIGLLRHELVDQEKWVDKDRFGKVLAVYQALPGPEATELCIYFGMLARGRLGGFLAGLGFIAPGFALLLLLSWAYMTYGSNRVFEAALVGAQPAVAALIVRGVFRIGSGVLVSPWTWAIAIIAAGAEWIGAPFYLSLLAGGFTLILAKRRQHVAAIQMLVSAVGAAYLLGQIPAASIDPVQEIATPLAPTSSALFVTGLRGGLLTFGGAYTAIPFVHGDAVVRGGWLTDGQFLEGIAMAGVMPAPLVMFVTFIGFAAAGLGGAVLITLGMFLPAFGITLMGHQTLERLVDNPRIHSFLDGVTAAVVGIIAATTIRLFPVAVPNLAAASIFVAILLLLFLWKSGWTTILAMISAALAGVILKQFGVL